jgi:hypothetical protein
MFNFYIGVGNLIVQIESSELSPLHLATDTLSMKMKEQPIYSMENLNRYPLHKIHNPSLSWLGTCKNGGE